MFLFRLFLNELLIFDFTVMKKRIEYDLLVINKMSNLSTLHFVIML